MDPDKVLEDLRESLVEYMNAAVDSEEEDLAVARAIGAAVSLDKWLTKGGLLPEDWSSR